MNDPITSKPDEIPANIPASEKFPASGNTGHHPRTDHLPMGTCPTWGQVKLAIRVLEKRDNHPSDVNAAAEKVLLTYLTADLPNFQLEHTKNAQRVDASLWCSLTADGDFS